MYGEGISIVGDLLDLAVKAEIVKKMGAWFSYGDSKIGQGREKTKVFLKENEKLGRFSGFPQRQAQGTHK